MTPPRTPQPGDEFRAMVFTGTDYKSVSGIVSSFRRTPDASIPSGFREYVGLRSPSGQFAGSCELHMARDVTVIPCDPARVVQGPHGPVPLVKAPTAGEGWYRAADGRWARLARTWDVTVAGVSTALHAVELRDQDDPPCIGRFC